MLIDSSTGHQTNLFGADLLQQLDPNDPLLRLACAIPWRELDRAFAKHYCQGIGRPAKPIRLMAGLLILKQLENLSDETVVLQFKRNPYYQAFCGSPNSAANCLVTAANWRTLENGSVRKGSTSCFNSASDCMAMLHRKRRSTSTPPSRKRTSPILPTANWRSKSSIA